MKYMKKSYLIGGLIIIVAIIVFFGLQRLSLKGPPEKVLGDNIELTVFTSDGNPTGKASVSVPFLKTLDTTAFIDVAVDLNNDGEYGIEEWIVKDTPVRTQKDWNNNFYFDSPVAFDEAKKVRVVLGTEQKDVEVTVSSFEVGNLLDLASVTNPEEATKGFGNSVVYAEDGVEVDVSIGGMPDISQQPGECGPTTAANSLGHLINKHGDEEDMPSDLDELIDQLKEDMNWTRENGVSPDDFAAGKNRWAERNGIPISTEKVGDKHGETTLDEIQEALENGEGVELRLKFGDPATGQAVGGHMVTVTGIHRGDGQTYIDIHDPASPMGTDTVEVQGNEITNYGLFEGWTLLSWGFIQTWEGIATGTGTPAEPTTPSEPEESGEPKEPEEEKEEDTKVADKEYGYDELAKMTPDEIRALGSFRISALSYNGKWFPFPGNQFIFCLSCPPVCEEFHYHGASGFSLDLQSVPEPSPSSCYWGYDVKTILVKPDEIINWFHNKP